jgi:hypothetical protein
MVDDGYIEATNKIILAGHGASVEMEAEEASMMPGMLVKTGTTVNEVKIGTEATVNYGWLGYENSPTMWKPANIDTAYAIAARVSVISGPGMVLRALLAAGQGGGGTDVKRGNKLVGTSGGALKIWVPVHDTDAADGVTEEMPVAIAMEDARANTAGNIIVRSLI